MGNSTGKLEYKILQGNIGTLNLIPLDILKAITDDFSKDQELGRDQFGVVYKGVLKNGPAIAVKKLSETHLDGDQFRKEVKYIFRLKHRNIVRLISYCAESQWERAEVDGKSVVHKVRERLLCYAYRHNCRLDLLISRTEPYELGWHKSYQIISGICRGLHYLHMECPCEIAHMDLKPQNILLDETMEPAIAHVGMLRLFGWQLPEIIKANGGATVGYMAPEYLANGLVSTKADIFSFGVIIIELMTGRRDYPSTEESYKRFVEKVIINWTHRLELGGRRYRLLEYYLEQVKTCILTGLMCVNNDPNKRPTTRDILERLNESDVMNMDKESMGELVHFDDGFMSDLNGLRKFGKLLGMGTYGTVYKATLKNGTVMAVRMFDRFAGIGQDFKAEVAVLGKIRHPNLVPLIAFYGGAFTETLIVMDYIPRGSLSAFLHDGNRNTPANWATRMEIAKGIARGLTCLHDDMGIIHGNLTAKNVLLDEDWQPKVADFGLFGLLKLTRTAANHKVLAGAVQPDASTKADVYNLGIIILELLTGKLPSSMDLPAVLMATDEWLSNMFDQVLLQDEDVGPSRDQLKGTLMLALECVDPSPSARPQAREVLSKLARICPGPKNAARPSEDRSPSLELKAFKDLKHAQPGPEDGASAATSNGVLSMSVRINADGVPEQEQKQSDYREMNFKLPLTYLRNITDDFSPDRELGSGGFGVVYKGIDTKSGAVIAVKKLKQILGEQEKQFKDEVNHLARLNHDNIVKLIGYCDETKVISVYDDNYQQKHVVAEVQKLLCYEHLPKGSLDNIIFNESLGHDWQDRYQIITGICQGLYYLHKTPIIHMDLKPSNILLDDRMVPKIADFGLSRLFSPEQTRTCTKKVMGSMRYMAPEYFDNGEISTKLDIYSLGILILEIVTGEKNDLQVQRNISGEVFIDNVRKHWSKMSHIASKHPSLGTECLQQVHRCIEIGLRCVETDQQRRPSAREVWLHIMQDAWQPMQGVLSVTVISGEDLPTKDTNGKANPYVALYLEKTKQKWSQTWVVKESLNPIWNQTFDFVVEDGLHDKLILEVYHNGTFYRGYMGRCILTLTNVLLEGEYQSFVLEGAKSGKLKLHLHWTPYRSNRASFTIKKKSLWGPGYFFKGRSS